MEVQQGPRTANFAWFLQNYYVFCPTPPGVYPDFFLKLVCIVRRKKEHDFQILDGSRTKFGPNSGKRLRMGSGNDAKHKKSLPNRRQQAAPSAPPKGAALRAAPLGSCCLLFGKDFLCFASFLEPILGRFPEFGPGPIQDLKIVFFFSPCFPETCAPPAPEGGGAKNCVFCLILFKN